MPRLSFVDKRLMERYGKCHHSRKEAQRGPFRPAVAGSIFAQGGCALVASGLGLRFDPVNGRGHVRAAFLRPDYLSNPVAGLRF